MSATFPWRSATMLGLEFVGVGIGAWVSTFEGASTGGIFLCGIHAIFMITVGLGFAFYYQTYSRDVAPELRLIFAAMVVFCLGMTGVYFYFIVKISDPNVFDSMLKNWGILTFFVLVFYFARLYFFTTYAYELYTHIIGTISVIEGKETEPMKIETPASTPETAPQPEKKKVPIYLLDYEKMFGNK
jgi:hypothetical protein